MPPRDSNNGAARSDASRKASGSGPDQTRRSSSAASAARVTTPTGLTAATKLVTLGGFYLDSIAALAHEAERGGHPRAARHLRAAAHHLWCANEEAQSALDYGEKVVFP